MARLTELLREAPHSASARDEACRQLYDQLKRIARAARRRKGRPRNMETTELVHEAMIRMMRSPKPIHWKDRGHFLGFASVAMRQVLCDHARREQAQKRGGGAASFSLDDRDGAVCDPVDDVVLIDELLEKLGVESPIAAKVAERRYFGGGTFEEIAESLRVTDGIQITAEQAEKAFKLAQAWILDAITRDA